MSTLAGLTAPGTRGRGARRRQWWRYAAVAPAALITLAIVFAPLLAPYPPNAQDLASMSQPPSLTDGHLFGTDLFGRDVFSRVLHGGRPPLLIGVLAVAAAVAVGVAFGVLAGFRGGRLDSVLARVADIQLSVPGIVIALFVLAMLGGGFVNVILVIALESWPLHFRVTRALAQGLRNRAFVEAARVFGLPTRTIITRHLVPALLPVIAVTATANFVTAVLMEASLSFLGLGIQPPTADWGLMVSLGRTQIASAWWVSVFSGLALAALLFSAQLLGDALAKRFSLEGADT
ncbi:ABC transporter permease [Acrocarpospora catenulata]|uniref:ABC transporter permease n=1 Tax=Acrocarpospora catenulata TaxID=2836182 RepID=UPI001BDA91F7|nr:ABC transporter permease [Acrocarpospora catenulata]